MIYYRHARFHGKVQKILNEESDKNHRLISVVMGDMMSRYDMIFEDSKTKYLYIHEYCRRGKTVAETINYYTSLGYTLAFHVMGDLATRHELFFEKEFK